MKKTIFLKAAFVMVLPAMMLTSYATILTGGSPTIAIDGDVKEPVTIITEKQTYANVQLPCSVQVNRHHLEGQRIKIQSENFDFKDIVLEKTINGVTFANIILGGLIGWGVDMITNCVSNPQSKNYFVEGKKKEKQEN
ncbi:MAG: hypothetical protein IJT55_03430 [Prevotella sp.]|nr:hypothetical protein [Prevotella sp.]